MIVVLLWLASLLAGGSGASPGGSESLAVPPARWPPPGVASAPHVTPPRATAPRHVVAAQGPTGGRPLRVLVTWDRADPAAVAHVVLRDGRPVARVRVAGEPWDDFAWTDRQVRAGTVYRYAVRAVRADGTHSRASRSFALRIRSDRQIGSGRVFPVDRFRGDDATRAQAAIDAARRAAGGVVLFGSRTYTLSRPLLVSGGGIVLRGRGRDQTVLRAGFPGAREACGRWTPLVTIRGDERPVTGVHSAADAPPRSRTMRVTRHGDLRRGDVVVFDQAPPQRTPATFRDENVPQDPAVGGDRRGAWDANEVVRVRGRHVRLRFPLAFGLERGTSWQRIERGTGGGIERMTLEGAAPDDRTYRVLLDVERVAHVTIADVGARWANRSFAQIGGYDITVVRFRGEAGGSLSADGQPCKYRISIVRAANVAVLDSEMGRVGRDDEQSFVSVQRAQRVTVRDSRFHGSRTYALNEHGAGSQELVFENNYIAAGPTAKFGGILLGNNTWGFAGPTIVRNNLLVGNSRDLALQENSYEVRFLLNHSVGARRAVVDAYGWAGPDTPPDRYGSLRLSVAGNDIAGAAGNGIMLGGRLSPWFPYGGVRDVEIVDNRFDVAAAAIVLRAPATETARLLVAGNRAVAAARVASRCAGVAHCRDGLRARGRGKEFSAGTSFTRPSWTRPFFGWERYDRKSR